MESNQLQFTEVWFWRSIFCFHSELKCCTFKSIYLIGNQRQKAQTSVICNNLSAQGETTTTMMKMKNVQLINTEPSAAVTVGGDPAGCWAAFFCTGGCFCYLVHFHYWWQTKRLSSLNGRKETPTHCSLQSSSTLWWAEHPQSFLCDGGRQRLGSRQKLSSCLSLSLFVSIHVWAVWMDSDPPPADHLPTRSARSPTGGRAWSM